MRIDPLEQFKNNAEQHGICGDYHNRWDRCCSNKQLIDLALCSEGLEYLCISIANGWGLSPNYISERFKFFINNAYISEQKGYSTKLFCQYFGNIIADTTAICVIDSNANIYIPKNHICKIYLSGVSEVVISGEGQGLVACFGEEEKIAVTDKTIKGCKFFYNKTNEIE